MGTGASAQASEAMQGASAVDMQAALDLLSDADRAKLQDALGQAPGVPADAAGPADGAGEAAAPAEAEGETKATKEEVAPPAEASGAAPGEAAAPAEAEGETKATKEEVAPPAEASGAAPGEAAAPAEAAAQGEGVAEAVASSEEAPFLSEYFDKAVARTAALLEDEDKLMALALDIEARTKLKEESKEWFEKEAKPLLEKSFKHHDTKNTGVLDKDEAAVFFAHMVKEETDMAKVMSALSIEAGIRMSLKQLEGLSEEGRAEIKPQIEKQMRQAIETAKAEVQKKEDFYKGDKAAHDAAAFKVLDTSGDGSVQLPEFIAAFEPETEMNINLHIALGYLTREEVEQQKKMEEQAKEDAKCASECNQQ